MNIGLIDVDGHGYPNFALMRLSAYHKLKGDTVEMAKGGLFAEHYDKIIASKIFTFSPDISDNDYRFGEIIRGGSGYNIAKKLPIEIEQSLAMDYSLYDYNFSIQFFSRGCIRKCPFCLVKEKEGNIHPVDPVELNPKGKWIEVFDNNFFANPEWNQSINYLLKKNQPVKLHGVDIRIMNEEQAYWLNKLKLKGTINIAWDLPQIDLSEKLQEVTKYIKPHKLQCYVLVGFNSTIEQDLFRIYRLKEFGIVPFVMPYRNFDNNTQPSQYAKDIARWANNKFIFKSTKFEDYKPRKGVYGRDYLNHQI